jgi:hypothetical protein
MTSPRRLADGRSTDYACGLGIGTLTGFTLWRHTGAVSGYNALNAVFPDRKSALVLLINSEDTAVLQDLFAALAPLLLPEPVQALPAIRPPALTAAQEFLKRLQRGKIDRARLGTDYSEFLDEAKLKAAARRLRALGAPLHTELRSVHERGGMEVTKTRFTFRSRALTALMYRSPDGQIQQYLLLRED